LYLPNLAGKFWTKIDGFKVWLGLGKVPSWFKQFMLGAAAFVAAAVVVCAGMLYWRAVIAAFWWVYTHALSLVVCAVALVVVTLLVASIMDVITNACHFRTVTWKRQLASVGWLLGLTVLTFCMCGLVWTYAMPGLRSW
jgi:hypothetical protein